MDEPTCPGCPELLQRVAELEAQVAELTRKLDDALRAGKRQAAPFRKGPPKPDPNTPGRKSGDAHGKHGPPPPPPARAGRRGPRGPPARRLPALPGPPRRDRHRRAVPDRH